MPLNSPPSDDAGQWLRYAERDLDSRLARPVEPKRESRA